MLTNWAREGVTVRTLTNAQEATDVLPVHGAYQQYRAELIEAGVKMYELKSFQDLPRLIDQFGFVGSQNSSLHAKSFVIDRSEIFVGSYNFDARSAFLNTEMGFLIKSPMLASEIASAMDARLDAWAYEVVLAGDGALNWIDRSTSGAGEVMETEPNTTALSRATAALFAVLPIEWML